MKTIDDVIFGDSEIDVMSNQEWIDIKQDTGCSLGLLLLEIREHSISTREGQAMIRALCDASYRKGLKAASNAHPNKGECYRE